MMRLLRGYKFEGRKRLRRHLGNLLFVALEDDFRDIDVVTSVPMTHSKEWRRGYNQSELVAMDLSKQKKQALGRRLSGVVMVEQVRSLAFRAREAKRVGRAPAAVLEEALSILDACIY